MERIIKIEATGSEIFGFIGFVKEKDAESTLKSIRKNYTHLYQRHGDKGKLKVETSVYNPELPYRL